MKVCAGVLLLTLSVASPAEASEASSLQFGVRQGLDISTRVLYDVIRPGYNPVPLAVLNRAHCVALVNGKGAQVALGIVSCRKTPNSWTGPAFLTYQNSNPAQASSVRELLILIMNDQTKESLLRGKLNLGQKFGTQPGLVVSGAAPLRESDVHANTFIYDLRPTGKLMPAQVDGSLTLDRTSTRLLYPKKAEPSQVLTGRRAVPGLAERYVTAVNSFFNMITPTGIIVHHSSALPETNRVPRTELQVDQFHEKRGFAVACSGRIYHVAYHYFILPNGKVKLGRPENCQGAHAHGYNSYLGISLAGDFSTGDNPYGRKGLMRPTRAQLRSLQILCEKIMRRYGISATNILRHSDVSNTKCPGDRFPYSAFLKSIEGPANSSATSTEPATAAHN